MTYEGLEPREQGVIEVESPIVWLEGAGGDEWSVVVRAANGRFRRPAR